MKYCTKCGKELFDEAVICPGCGCACENTVKKSQQPESSGLARVALCLAFSVPIVGFILGIVGATKYKNETYRGRCVAAIFVSVLSFILGLIVIMSMGM